MGKSRNKFKKAPTIHG